MRNRQIGSGPEDFSLIWDQLYINGVPVESGEEVFGDPASQYEMQLGHNVANADPRSLGDPFGVWSTCMTIEDLTNQRAIGSRTAKADGGAGGGNPVLNIGRITATRTFRVKLWANQNDNAVPPPQSSW
jgi:hypothetical protein